MRNDTIGYDECNGPSRIHLKNNHMTPFIPSRLKTIKAPEISAIVIGQYPRLAEKPPKNSLQEF